MYTCLEAFEIEFFANGEDYKATVHKIPADYSLPVEYHVFNIQPTIPKAPRAFMFIYNTEESTFDCTVFNDDVELSENMFSSIKKYCIENDTPLSA
jgi:hypothetical protein